MSSIFGDTPHVQLATQHVVMNLQRVGATIRSTARLEVVRMDDLYAELAHRLEAYVLAEKLVGDTHKTTVTKTVPIKVAHSHPTSWFQDFKWRHLPTIAKRWPVKWDVVIVDEERTVSVPVEVTFERYATYPQADIAIPHDRLGAPVIFERVVPA